MKTNTIITKAAFSKTVQEKLLLFVDLLQNGNQCHHHQCWINLCKNSVALKGVGKLGMTSFLSTEINIYSLYIYILIYSVRCNGADSPASLLLLCTFCSAPLIFCFLHCHLYFHKASRSGKGSQLNWCRRPFCTCVNKMWSDEHCHKKLCNINSFWDNSAGISDVWKEEITISQCLLLS